jgi:hypothetical protein
VIAKDDLARGRRHSSLGEIILARQSWAPSLQRLKEQP